MADEHPLGLIAVPVVLFLLTLLSASVVSPSLLAQSPDSPDSKIDSGKLQQYDPMFCELLLSLNVGEGEKVVMQYSVDDGPITGTKTVEGPGDRISSFVAPENSTVVIYAIDLEDGTAKRLDTMEIPEGCTE